MRLRTALLSLAVASVAALAAFAVSGPHTEQAEALGRERVLGVYRLKLKGTGFDRDGSSARYRDGKVRGLARMTLTASPDEGDDSIVRVVIRLDERLDGTIADKLTPEIAFAGTGRIVGDSLTAIASGQANFVNALTIEFSKNGRKAQGWWLASFPAAAATDGFAGAFGAQVKGKLIEPAAIEPLPLDRVSTVR